VDDGGAESEVLASVAGMIEVREPGRGELAEVGIAVAFRLGPRCWAGTWHGRSVAVRWSPPGASADEGTAQLLGLRHPALAPVLAVRVLPGGATVVVSRLIAGRRWPEVHPAGSLGARELARLVLPVARGLAAAHELGLVAGRLRAENLVVTDEGDVVLTGARTLSSSGGEGGEGGEADGDVEALCGVLSAAWDARVADPDLRLALSGTVRDATGLAALLARVSGATAGPTRPRPSLAARSGSAARPGRPLPAGRSGHPLAAVATGPRHRKGTRLRERVRAGAVGAVAVLAAGLLCVLVTGLVLHRLGAAPADAGMSSPATADGRGSAVAPPAAPDWTRVVTAVERARSRAFDELAGLASADQPGSAAYRIDAARLSTLRARGLRVVGLSVRLEGVRVLRRDGPRIDLEVRDWVSACTVWTLSGRVAGRVAPGPARTWVLLLIRTGAGWRLDSAAAA
jgi:hypothetical protein